MNFPPLISTKSSQFSKPNEVAVEVVKLPKYDKKLTENIQYALIVAHPHKNHADLVLLENGNELETKYTKFYRTVITNKIADDYSYPQFWQKLEASLDKKTTRIYLSSDGAFNQVNVNTLKKPSGKYVIEEMEVISVSSGRQIEEVQNLKPILTNKTILLLANFPYYGNSGTVAPLARHKEGN